jgi:hypothetical protein
MMPFRPTQLASKMILCVKRGREKSKRKSWQFVLVNVPVIQALSHSEQCRHIAWGLVESLSLLQITPPNKSIR